MVFDTMPYLTFSHHINLPHSLLWVLQLWPSPVKKPPLLRVTAFRSLTPQPKSHLASPFWSHWWPRTRGTQLHITYYYVFLCAYVHFIHFNMVIVFWARLGGLSGRILWCRGQCEIWTTNGIHHYSPLLGCFRIRRTNRRRRRVCPRAWGHQVGDWLFHQGPLTTKCSLGRGISNFAFTSHNSSIFLKDVTPRAAFEIGINNPSKLTGGICSNVGAVSCFNADSRWLARSVTRGWTFKIETLDKKM